MISLALVGLGEVGQHHCRAIATAPATRFAWACDLDDGLLGASGAERTTHDLDEVLADPSVDAISVCLPHHLHAPVAVRALAAGKHVLLEKPMAMSVAEADQVIAAARTAGRSVGVSHNQALYLPHARARRLIDDGAVGRVLQIRARLAIGGKYGAWRADPAQAGGGLLFDAGVHRVYVMRLLGGEVSAVTAIVDRAGREDGFIVVLEFASGATGVIDGTYHCPEGVFDDRVEIAGSAALVEIAGLEAYFEGFADPTTPQLRIYRDGAWSADDVRDTWDASVRRSVQGFIAAVAAGRPPPVTAQDGRAAVAIIEAAYASAREGRTVKLD